MTIVSIVSEQASNIELLLFEEKITDRPMQRNIGDMIV